MTRLQFTTRVVKPVLFLAGLGPALWMVWAGFTAHLGADPVHKIQEVTGLSTLTILMITLAVTPVRRLTGWNEVIRLRRMIGLFAFFYVCLHAVVYFVLDQSLSAALIWEDTQKHPRIFVGLAAFLLLIPLAVTSTDKMVRRLGKRWGKLHAAVYVAAALGVLHFLWVVKWDVRVPVMYAWVFVGLMAARVLHRRRQLRVARTASGATISEASPELRPRLDTTS
jgi:methionine sulfoxide reductase heme-binding subunit